MRRRDMRSTGLLLLLVLVCPSAAYAGESALIQAVKAGDAGAIRAQLRRGGVNAADAEGATALHWAVQRDDLATVDALLKAGAVVGAPTRLGVTSIMLASTNGNGPILDRLLKAGADANSATAQGETVLMFAARTGAPDAVKVLLTHGANVNAAEKKSGQTALMWAAVQNRADAIKVLVEAGADVHAVAGDLKKKYERISIPPTTVLPTPYNDTNTMFRQSTPTRFTPLLFAARAGSIDAARALIAAGANVNDTLTDGTSALVLAIINAHYELAGVLLDKGANPNADAQGWTALHQLVWTDNPNPGRPTPFPVPTGAMSALELMQKLLEKGANPNARQREEPLDGNRNVLNRVGATPFLLAAKVADVDMMRMLAAHGADPTLSTEGGATPLMVAAGVGIWKFGENVGTNEEAFECVKFAWEVGAGDINATDDNGDTALHGAAHRESQAIVEFLVSKGAKLDIRNKISWTPLSITLGVYYPSSYKRHPETAEVLRRLGAKDEGVRRDIDLSPTELESLAGKK